MENPRAQTYQEEIKAVTTLRSGKIIDNKVGLNNNKANEEKEKEKECLREQSQTDKVKNIIPQVVDESIPYEPKLPFPEALKSPSPNGKDKKMEDILETFKQVKINIPLLEAIKQVPAYAKLLKDMCTFKRKSKNHVSKMVFLNEQVSSVLQYNTPPKLKDPGVPTITCFIGDKRIDRALLDFGSSVNLIPYSVYEELVQGELQPTNMTLQLADRSIKVPRGRIDDVLVQVDKCYFPVGFVVLDMDSTNHTRNQTPVILRRPFLATANATINCRTGVMDVSVLNMRVKLNVFKASSQPSIYDDSDCFKVDIIDEIIQEALPTILKFRKNLVHGENFDLWTSRKSFLQLSREYSQFWAKSNLMDQFMKAHDYPRKFLEVHAMKLKEENVK
ncbi:uncharacterized protein G2W53_037369 [Senna tora]|uniref:Aspartic peptidase DDI1-type domain-containing protein n=1 Tax=Senna tora TaxID=362788 RepID=A0A834SVN3_9FABA|nr:uncharacterized protein G2W53_037369 [Senna tora]